VAHEYENSLFGAELKFIIGKNLRNEMF